MPWPARMGLPRLGGERVRPSLIRVRSAAIEANAARLAALAPDAALCAVVKAGGYGHGAVTAAAAARAGGASWLAVATAAEAAELADAVDGNPPVLVLSELDPDDAAQAAAELPHQVRFTVATPAGVEALTARSTPVRTSPVTEAPASRSGPAGPTYEPEPLAAQSDLADASPESEPPPARSAPAVRPPRRVHLKIDTGMHRMGADPGDLAPVADALTRAAVAGAVRLEGVWTHLAVADDPADEFTAVQLTRFETALAELSRLSALSAAGPVLPQAAAPVLTPAAAPVLTRTGTGPVLAHAAAAAPVLTPAVAPVLTHAANSAGLLAHPRSHREMVRAGIALYGVAPAPALAGRVQLEPALDLVSRVTAVRSVAAGESVSYGRSWYASEPVRVATVPIGYADGVRRHSGAAGVEILIRGRRRPILGTVTMDQLMAAVDPEVAVGDEVVLIGAQGPEQVTVDEVAERLGTIPYEVLVGLGPRLPRVTV